MALVTVADVLAEVLARQPGGYTLAGGAAGLEREVTWTMSARPASPIFPTLKPGELALASAAQLRELDPPANLALLVDWLAERQAAALVLRGPVGARERKSAAAMADERGLPLIVLEGDTAAADVEREVTDLVRDRRDEFYRRTAHLQEIQFQLAEGRAGALPEALDTLVRALAKLVGAPAALTGPPPTLDLRQQAGAPTGRAGAALPLAATWPDLARRLLAAWQAPDSLRAARPAEPPVLALPIPDGTLLAAPAIVRDRLAAVLLLAVPAPIAAIDKLTLARAAGICALEMARRHSVAAAETRTEQRLRGEFIADLLNYEAGSGDEVLLSRARALGVDLAPAYAVALVGVDRAGEGGDSRLAAAATAIAPALRDSGALLQLLPGRLAMLWPAAGRVPGPTADSAPPAPPPRLLEVAAELCRHLDSNGDGTAAAGVGRVFAGLGAGAQSRREAEQALWAAQHLFGPEHVCAYHDLGIYRLLLPLRSQQPEELRAFYQETLGALAAGEANGRGGTSTKLLDTLEAFLAHGGNVSETAAALYLHRNTLSYRLRRISEIAGLDLDDPAVRFRAQVALHVRRLLRG